MLNIFDFDGTLYYNPSNDFTDDIVLKNIVPKNEVRFLQFAFLPIELSNAKNILITGRHEYQKEIVLNALAIKGYRFEKTVFFDLGKEFYERPDFMNNYRKWKISKIKKIISQNPNAWINVYDDDICLLLNLDPYRIHVFLVKILNNRLKLKISNLR